MEEAPNQKNFFKSFDQWLEVKYPDFYARLPHPEPFTQEESERYKQYNDEYINEKKAQAVGVHENNSVVVVTSLEPVSPLTAFDSFGEFLQSRNPDPGNISREAMTALNVLFNFSKGHGKSLAYDPTFETFAIDGKEYFFPAMYFKTGFTSPNVFIATQKLLEGSENPEVKQWKQHDGKCISPQFDPANPYADAVRDITSSLKIVVETVAAENNEIQDGTIVYKTIPYVTEADNNNNDNNSDNSDAALKKREIAKNRKIVNELYDALESYGVNKKVFENALKGYSQSLLYRVLAVMSAVLPRGEFQMHDREKMISRLVFCLNGDVYLDLYGAECDISLPHIPMGNGMPLSRPIQIGAVFRYVFSEKQNAFLHPMIICDGLYAHFLATKNYELKAPAVQTPKNKLPTEQQEAAVIEKVDATLEAKQQKVLHPKAVGKIRKPAKHTKKIMVSVAAGTFFLTLGAGLALIPGGQMPGALSALLGFTIDVVASAGFAAAGSAILSAAVAALTYVGIRVNRSVNKQTLISAQLKYCTSFENSDPRQLADSFYAMVAGGDTSDVEGFLKSIEQEEPLSIIGTIDLEEERSPLLAVAAFYYHREAPARNSSPSGESDEDACEENSEGYDKDQEELNDWVVVARPQSPK